MDHRERLFHGIAVNEARVLSLWEKQNSMSHRRGDLQALQLHPAPQVFTLVTVQEPTYGFAIEPQ